MPAGLHIAELSLVAPVAALPALERFYRDELELSGARGATRLDVRVGATRLTFGADAEGGEPFYHFALLVPGDRFAAARAWLAQRARLLPRPGSADETVFDFSFWDALACYCHDPAGNIVELIAHRGLGERPERDGPFAGAELLAVSEIGLVTPRPGAAAAVLEAELALRTWSGEARDDSDALAFVGRKAHTLILSRPGRGWLPTGRPAEPHPVAVRFADGDDRAAVTLPGAPHRVRRGPASAD